MIKKKLFLLPLILFLVFVVFKYVIPKLSLNKTDISLKSTQGLNKKKTTYQKSSELTVEEKIQNYKGRIKVNPKDYKAYFQLGTIFSEQRDDGLTFLYFRKTMAIAPNSYEGKNALKWINHQRQQARSVWLSQIGPLYLKISQVEPVDFEEKLKEINEKVEKDFKSKKKAGKEFMETATEENKPTKKEDYTSVSPSAPSYMLVPITPLTPTAKP